MGKKGKQWQTLLFGAPKSLQMITAITLRHLLLGRKAVTNLDSHVKKQRPFFDKGLYNQSYVFSSSYVWMWEKAMAPHSSTLAWKIPWMEEEPDRLRSMGLQRVGHDWATSFSLFHSCIGEGNGHPLQCSCLENPRDGGAWWAAVSGVAQSGTTEAT